MLKQLTSEDTAASIARRQRDARQLEFDMLYDAMAYFGICDGAGGEEHARVWREFVEFGPESSALTAFDDMVNFIKWRANITSAEE